MNRKVFILGICLLHFLTAALLCISPAPMGVTAVRAVALVFGEHRFLLAALYFTAAALALHRELRPIKCGRSVWWYLPSLYIVISAAIGALVCIAQGSYADGVQRPVAFILRDQFIYILVAAGYSISISRE